MSVVRQNSNRNLVAMQSEEEREGVHPPAPIETLRRPSRVG